MTISKDLSASVIKKILMYFVIVFTIMISIYPIFWVITSSLKTNEQILNTPLSLPTQFDPAPYQDILSRYNFLEIARNSFIVSVIPSMISLFFYAMTAYAIAKFNFPGKKLFYALFAMTILIPAFTRIQPLFTMVFQLGLYDTLMGLSFIYLSNGLAMSLFVLRSAFMSIPDSLSEAARIDGAGFFRTYWQINLPLVTNSLLTAGILMFLTNWNEFFFASLVTTSEASRTLPVWVGLFDSSLTFDYPKLFAALSLALIPGIVIYAFTAERMQKSVASSGVKG